VAAVFPSPGRPEMVLVMTEHAPHLTTRTAPRPWLARRWPSALALPVVALSVWGMADGRDVAFVVVLAGVCYLVAAMIGRPASAWWIAVLGSIPVTAAMLLDVDSSIMLFAVAVAALLVAATRRFAGLGAQAGAALGFGLIAPLALATGPTVGGLLVAGGLLGHAAWDAYHHRVNRVVTRSYAEWCGVVDALLGLAVLLVVLAS